MDVISFFFGNLILIHVIFSCISNANNELTILEYLGFLEVIWGCGLVMGMVGNSVFFFLIFFSFYVAPNTVKYFLEHFPEYKQTPEKQTFFCKLFAFANILRWRMFYIETNGALQVP